jgi:hypothetical protein
LQPECFESLLFTTTTAAAAAAAASASADLTCEVASSEDGSMVKKIDPESGTATATKHYVPVLELFRGHWQGIIIQACYEACEWTNGDR